MVVSVVAMATANSFLFLVEVFEGTEERIWMIYFSGSLVGSFFSLSVLGWITLKIK